LMLGILVKLVYPNQSLPSLQTRAEWHEVLSPRWRPPHLWKTSVVIQFVYNVLIQTQLYSMVIHSGCNLDISLEGIARPLQWQTKWRIRG
jgi:hypothetical protein